MIKLWLWVKGHAVWLLGGLAAVLGALLAIKYEREKIQALKTESELNKAMRDIDALEERRKALLSGEAEMEAKDFTLETKIEEKRRQLEAKRRDIGARSNAAVVARFNALYGYTKDKKSN